MEAQGNIPSPPSPSPPLPLPPTLASAGQEYLLEQTEIYINQYMEGGLSYLWRVYIVQSVHIQNIHFLYLFLRLTFQQTELAKFHQLLLSLNNNSSKRIPELYQVSRQRKTSYFLNIKMEFCVILEHFVAQNKDAIAG